MNILRIILKYGGKFMSKHVSIDIRVPVENDNPAIRRIESLCIRCGQCKDCLLYTSCLRLLMNIHGNIIFRQFINKDVYKRQTYDSIL